MKEEDIPDLIIVSDQVLISNKNIQPASIYIKNEKIINIKSPMEIEKNCSNIIYVEQGNIVLPGLIDSHVHVNEPGRTEWEGFDTATKAAAFGGVTCIADMPLNSIPPTTTVPNFEIKLKSAENKCWIDIRFIGGVVSDNIEHIKPLLNAGVCGFKCFLIHSGVNEFSHVSPEQALRALEELKGTNSFLMFHAELEDNESIINENENPKKYETFLKSRPKNMENKAIELIISLCRETNVRCHIVHLSSSDAIPLIEQAKKEGLPISVETCYHYLFFDAESIPNAKPEYKCCPPIREKDNREKLWDALKNGIIDMVVSDHSPCTEDLKKKNDGDYMASWGGISSLQFGLSILYTEAIPRGFNFIDIMKWVSEEPAKLIGIGHKKGKIEIGYDADLIIFNPNKKFIVEKNNIQFKNKLSAYIGKELSGIVEKTILRGHIIVNNNYLNTKKPLGKLILNSN